MLVKDFKRIEKTDNGYLVTTAQALIKLVFMTDDIVRIRVSFDGEFAEHSYALVTTAWEDDLDELFKDERERIKPLDVAAQESEQEIVFETNNMVLTMKKHPVSFSLLDKSLGCTVYSDLKERAYERDQVGRLFHFNAIDPKGDHFFGFGEKTGHLDKKGRHMRTCPKDAIGHDPEFGDPMYKHIPFYVRVNENIGGYVGLFYNNSYDCAFDMGNERSGYWDPYSYYQADGGDIDLFLINGPSIKQVVERYTYLTGRSAMPTMQSLGFTSSTMYYAELERNCDEEIYDVINKHLEENIYVDNFWLASGYSAGEKDKLRYTFNWNYQRFPDPKKFFDTMNAKGINVIPNLKIGVLMGHPYKEYYKEHDALIKKPCLDANGPSAVLGKWADHDDLAAFQNDPYYVGKWWGGPGYFVDFTGSKGRDAWQHLLEENILKMGTRTVWNDNNEADGVEDRNAVVAAEGKGGTMAEYKAIQSNMMAYTGKKAIANVYPNERPYIINRAGYSGIQRYAQVWGGDNLTDWRTVKFNVATILGMGLSGVANMGCDIGGFAGSAPEGELLLRWIQNGIFQPRFTMNSANNDNTVTQPWMYQEYLPQIKEAYALRYRYLIYIYALMRQAHLDGTPALRPLFYECEQDIATLHDQNLSFMFGPYILVANVLEKGQKVRPIYLPAGHTWYDLNDNFKSYEGGQTIEYPVDENSIPMFLKDSAIVITSPDIKRIVFDKVKTLELTIAAPESLMSLDNVKYQELLKDYAFSFDYYEDDGHTKDFENGVYANTKITVTPGQVMEIDFAKSGSYEHSYEQISGRVVSKHKGALQVLCDGVELKRFLVPDDFHKAESGWCYNLSSRVIEFKCKKPNKDNFKLIVSTKHFDLIGMENNG